MTKTNVDPGSISWSSQTDERKTSASQRVRDLDSVNKTDVRERLSAGGDGRLEDLLGASHNTDFVMEKVSKISTEEAISILEGAIEYHEDDPNFPDKTMSKIKSLVKAFSLGEKDESSEFDLKFEAVLIGYISPYPEVRSVVDATDDVDIPFFTTRQPKISISAAVIQLFLYPTGKILDKLLPDWGFVIRGTRYSLNPGPWSLKHLRNQCIGFQFLVQYSSQYIGMGLAGTMRRWVVYPIRALWPTILPTIAMNRALLKAEMATIVHGWSISRDWFFWVVFAIAFVTYWIPGYLITALGTSNWINWMAPNNFNLAVISGSTLGLGFNPITTFDWTIINYGFDPLSMPFYIALNQYGGLVLSVFAIIVHIISAYQYERFEDEHWRSVLRSKDTDERTHGRKEVPKSAYEDVGHSEDAAEIMHCYLVGVIEGASLEGGGARKTSSPQLTHVIVRRHELEQSAPQTKRLLSLRTELAAFAVGTAGLTYFINSCHLLPSLTVSGFHATVSQEAHAGFIQGFFTASAALGIVGLAGLRYLSNASKTRSFSSYAPHLQSASPAGATFKPAGVLNPSEYRKFTLQRKDELSDGIYRFVFDLPTKYSVLGLPIGQHVAMRAMIDDHTVVRSYTPVSNNRDLGRLELLIRVYSKGLMGNYLKNLKIGDTADIRGPKVQ